jgi:hypothetical protein
MLLQKGHLSRVQRHGLKQAMTIAQPAILKQILRLFLGTDLTIDAGINFCLLHRGCLFVITRIKAALCQTFTTKVPPIKKPPQEERFFSAS